MAAAGLFGKMPSAGDFVARGLSSALCAGLDGFLQKALLASVRDGGSVRQAVEAAPPVVVSIRPGALADGGFTGLWSPSSDRVGRAFPLCVGVETDSDAQACGHWPSAALARTLHCVLSESLEAGHGPDELMAQLPDAQVLLELALAQQPFADAGDATVPSTMGEAGRIWLEGPEDQMPVASRALGSRMPLAFELLGAVLQKDGSFAAFFGSRNLASPDAFAALFDGRWQAWGWDMAASSAAATR